MLTNSIGRRSLYCLFVLFLFYPIELHAINPIEYGLKGAKNGEERFWALYNAHVSANQTKESVSYASVGDLDIEIPVNAKSIPITWDTDFCGITITVKNTVKDFTLFSYTGQKKAIVIAKRDVDGKSFTKYEELREGVKVLITKDESPWIENRKGFTYGATRSDIRLLVDGNAQNDVIMPYNNTQSKPSCSFFISEKRRKTIGNLKFVRSHDCKYITRLFDIDACNNILIHDVAVFTPSNNNLMGDAVISVSNSTNVTFKDINIKGTYSHIEQYGYGISLGNVWNVKCYNIDAEAEWGVFCCNNVNHSFLKQCVLNRYDCHCYGRDIIAEDCVFHDLSNQVSSVYGRISFKNCVFQNFIPIYLRDDYNSYVPFDVKFYKCKFYVTNKAHSLIYMGGLYSETSNRPELARICWPNIEIRNIEIVSEEGIDEVSLFDVNKSIPQNYTVDYISRIDARKVKIYGDILAFDISRHTIKTKNKVFYSFKQRGSSTTVNSGNVIGLTEEY